MTAVVQGQSYVSISGNSVIYPGIGVTSDSATTAALAGLWAPRIFPSAAYARLAPSHAIDVDIVAAGTAPQDNFSGYPKFGDGGSAHWGDYPFDIAEGGSLWLATEYIPGGIDAVNYYTDFGTFVYSINPN